MVLDSSAPGAYNGSRKMLLGCATVRRLFPDISKMEPGSMSCDVMPPSFDARGRQRQAAGHQPALTERVKIRRASASWGIYCLQGKRLSGRFFSSMVRGGAQKAACTPFAFGRPGQGMRSLHAPASAGDEHLPHFPLTTLPPIGYNSCNGFDGKSTVRDASREPRMVGCGRERAGTWLRSLAAEPCARGK